jgi:hypothetical protein
MEEKLIEEIISEVKRGDNGSGAGFESYDTWGSPDRSNKFHNLKYYVVDKGLNSIIYKGEIYVVSFDFSNGKTAMGATPDSISILVLKPLKL